MSLERTLHECRVPGCEAKFLTVDARNGHESVHVDDLVPDTIGGEVP